jgi:hypothetical protein
MLKLFSRFLAEMPNREKLTGDEWGSILGNIIIESTSLREFNGKMFCLT